MIIQNDKFTGKSKITRIALLIAAVSLSVIALLINTVLYEFGFNVFINGSQKALIILLIIGMYMFIVWNQQKKKFFFIYVTDEDKEHITFRFYHIKTIGKQYTTYKIPFSQFYKYEIIPNGINKDLVLYQKVQDNKIAKYPPISITAFSQEELYNLKELLNNYLPKNK